MPGMLLTYSYADPKTGNTYVGQVVADSTITKYNYQPGATYASSGPDGGSYTISNTPGTPTTAPSGAVYQTSYYDAATKTSYDSYKYDVASNTYYDVAKSGYNSAGMYQPPTPAGGTAPAPIPMWSSVGGLGSEYGYIKAPNNTYNVYGGGGTANAQITPSALGTQQYYYQFMYSNGNYYDGYVYDNGTYGYKVGQTIAASDGTYSIYAAGTTPVPATALAGQTYGVLYHDVADNTNYTPVDQVPGNPYYGKPDGYGGVRSASDWIQKPTGYYKYDENTAANASTPVATLPLPT